MVTKCLNNDYRIYQLVIYEYFPTANCIKSVLRVPNSRTVSALFFSGFFESIEDCIIFQKRNILNMFIGVWITFLANRLTANFRVKKHQNNRMPENHKNVIGK